MEVPTQIIATLIHRYRNSPDNMELNAEIKKIKNFEDFNLSVLSRDIDITGFSYYADNYAVLELILKKFYAMDISVRNVQRLIYGEIAPLKPVYESIIDISRQGNTSTQQDGYGGSWAGSTFGTDGADTGKDDFDSSSAALLKSGANNRNNSSDTMPGSSSIGGHEKNKDVNKGIRLYDELKLANRFKDEEIRYIISMLEKEVINIGSKYFITLDSSTEFKKINNVITFTVNLKQKD